VFAFKNFPSSSSRLTLFSVVYSTLGSIMSISCSSFQD
jgi:hypothetical protein